jgi:hypothetical protein
VPLSLLGAEVNPNAPSGAKMLAVLPAHYFPFGPRGSTVSSSAPALPSDSCCPVGPSTWRACSVPTSASCRCSRLTAFAAHSEDASRPQPQEQVTSQTATGLLDHLIRPLQERRRDRQAEGLGGLEIDDQLELRGLRKAHTPGCRPGEDDSEGLTGCAILAPQSAPCSLSCRHPDRRSVGARPRTSRKPQPRP